MENALLDCGCKLPRNIVDTLKLLNLARPHDGNVRTIKIELALLDFHTAFRGFLHVVHHTFKSLRRLGVRIAEIHRQLAVRMINLLEFHVAVKFHQCAANGVLRNILNVLHAPHIRSFLLVE